MNPLRSAFARYIDDPYAAAVRGAGKSLYGAGPAPARDFVASTVEMMGTPMGIGTPIGNRGLSTLRYGIPAVGVTTAGAGLMELTQQLGDPDQAEELILLSQ